MSESFAIPGQVGPKKNCHRPWDRQPAGETQPGPKPLLPKDLHLEPHAKIIETIHLRAIVNEGEVGPLHTQFKILHHANPE